MGLLEGKKGLILNVANDRTASPGTSPTTR